MRQTLMYTPQMRSRGVYSLDQKSFNPLWWTLLHFSFGRYDEESVELLPSHEEYWYGFGQKSDVEHWYKNWKGEGVSLSNGHEEYSLSRFNPSPFWFFRMKLLRFGNIIGEAFILRNPSHAKLLTPFTTLITLLILSIMITSLEIDCLMFSISSWKI